MSDDKQLCRDDSSNLDTAKVAIYGMQVISESLKELQSAHLSVPLVKASLEKIAKSLKDLEQTFYDFQKIDQKEITNFIKRNSELVHKDIDQTGVTSTNQADVLSMLKTLETYSSQKEFTDEEADQLNEAKKLLISYKVSSKVSQKIKNEISETDESESVKQFLDKTDDNQPLSSSSPSELNQIAIILIAFISDVLVNYIDDGKIDLVFALVILGSFISIFKSSKKS